MVNQVSTQICAGFNVCNYSLRLQTNIKKRPPVRNSDFSLPLRNGWLHTINAGLPSQVLCPRQRGYFMSPSIILRRLAPGGQRRPPSPDDHMKYNTMRMATALPGVVPEAWYLRSFRRVSYRRGGDQPSSTRRPDGAVHTEVVFTDLPPRRSVGRKGARARHQPPHNIPPGCRIANSANPFRPRVGLHRTSDVVVAGRDRSPVKAMRVIYSEGRAQWPRRGTPDVGQFQN